MHPNTAIVSASIDSPKHIAVAKYFARSLRAVRHRNNAIGESATYIAPNLNATLLLHKYPTVLVARCEYSIAMFLCCPRLLQFENHMLDLLSQPSVRNVDLAVFRLDHGWVAKLFLGFIL